MKEVGYYNGVIGPLAEMTVPIFDRALYFGDGIYEATCVANRIPFALDDHLDRMYNSLRLMEIPFKMTREEIKAELQKVIDAAEEAPIQFLYWQITRGNAMRNHVFPKNVEPSLLIYVKPHQMKDLAIPYNLISMEDIRFKLCHIKTLNLIPSVLANQRAAEAGCDEAVLHRGSRVTECAHSNISILKDGVLRTAPTDELILPGITRKHLLALAKEHGIPTDELILPGITRKHLIELAKQNNIPVDESPFSMVELMNADEIIVTSSSALCIRVASIDGIPVGGKDPERIKLLQDAYWNKFVTETTPKA